jgi:glyoxylase-like metal-dependent hydrolase (beta-lactamase superfamily II)
MRILPLDLQFQDAPQAIAAYLIPHSTGGILIETGPGSTVSALTAALAQHGLVPSQITHVFLTHIHLDHAGAAGWMAQQGARIHVHPRGAPHLIAPDRLIASATRIYGDMMDTLWGDFLSVPEENLHVLTDEETVSVDGIEITALDTPGHARHHYAYLVGETCFTGDVGGVRLPGPPHIRLPMPPPEIDLDSWRASVRRLMRHNITQIAPTHFGLYQDVDWHWNELLRLIDEVDAWLAELNPDKYTEPEMREHIQAWTDAQSRKLGITPEMMQTYELANPTWMSAAGVKRFWKKFRS